MKRLIKFTGIIIVSFILIGALLLGGRIYQTYKTEGNASDILKAVVKLELSSENIIKINQGMYLTKSNTKVVKEILKNKGWQFEEQMGAGYQFRSSGGEILVLTTRQVVSSRYLIWQGRNIDDVRAEFILIMGEYV
jgi:predicted RNA binding protein YcfA (HicA-like mRNA interferase family)